LRVPPTLYSFGEHRQNVLRFVAKRRPSAGSFPVLAAFFQRKKPASGFDVKTILAMPKEKLPAI
jgi:hypothetical protein